MKWTSKDNNRARRGFTLAELLMTVAIIGILAAFGFVAVVQHQKSLKLTEMDNAAREIFVAAQNHLSESKSSGDWGKIYNKHKDETTNSVSTLYLGGNFDQTLDKTKTVTDSKDKSKHDWRTITVTPETVTELRKNTALGVMLPVGATDETLLSGSCYVVEYDAMTATVYGVFYTDKTQAGVDETDIAEIDNMNGGREDGNSNRKQFQKSVNGTSYTYAIGYYGGASATESTISKTSVKFTVTAPTLELRNEERLLLIVTDSNKSNLRVQSADQKNAECNYKLTLTVHDSDGHQMNIGDSVPNYPSGDRIVYILDSVADGEAVHFARLFHSENGTGLTPGSNIYVTADATVTWNDNTGNEKSASAQAASDTHNSLFADGSGSDAGALIENGRHLQNLSTSVSGVTGIYTKAHLKNDIAWNTEGGSKNTVASFINGLQNEEKNYSITKTSTLDFRSIYNASLTSFDGTNGTTSYTLSSFTVKGDTTNESDRVDAGLFSKAAADFTVQDLSVDAFTVTSETSGSAGAILGTYQPETATSKLTLQNVTVQNSTVGEKIKDSSAAANVASGMLVGSTTDGILNLKSCSVKGTIAAYGTKAGGLVGLENASSVILQNCNVGEKDEASKITISATEAAGGLVGRHTSGSLLISNDNVKANEVDVSAFSGQGAAGGLIGAAKMPKKENSTDMITALNITGSSVEAGNITVQAGRHAGGAIGQYNLSNVKLNDAKQKASLTIDTVTVKADTKLSIESAGSTTSQDTYCAGGMIGEMKDAITATLNACKVDAPTVSISATDISGDKGEDNSHVTASGGLVGQIYFSGNCKPLNGSQALNIQIGDSDITASTSASINAETNNKWMDGAAGGYLGSIVLNSGKTTVPVIRISGAGITTPEIFVSSTDKSSGGDGNENSAGGLIGSVHAADSYTTRENNSAIQIAKTNLTVNGSKNTAFNVSAADDAGGLIGIADKHTDFSVTSSKLDVSNSAVTSTTGNAGGLVGSCAEDDSGNTLNDTVSGYSISTRTLNISAGKNAGGLIGLFSNNGHLALKVLDSTIQAENLTVAGTKEAGGIAGSLQNNKKDQAVSSVSNCNVDGGATGLVHSTGGNAGGFVGSAVNSNFTDCYTTLLVDTDPKDEKYAAGGFGGSLDNVTVNRCYAGGRTKNGEYTEEENAINSGSVVLTYAQNVSGPVAGGFAGITDRTTTIRNSYTTCSVYSKNECAGGFVGSICGDDKDASTTINNCYCTGLVTTEDDKASAGLFAGKKNKKLSGESNYCLKDLDGNVDDTNTNVAVAVVHTDNAIKGNVGRASAYDTSLKKEIYPFKTVSELSGDSSLNRHNGDWPAVFKKEEKKQSFNGDFGVIYYEVVQHGAKKNGTADVDYYYHGFMGDMTDNGEPSNYKEVKTADTNSAALTGRAHNDHDLLTGHNEYVVEEGYLLLFGTDYQQTMLDENQNRKNSNDFEQKLTVEIGENRNDGNNSGLILETKCKDQKLGKYNKILEHLNIKGYDAYIVNCSKYVGDSINAGTRLKIDNDYFDNWGNFKKTKEYAQFYFQPMFSDTLSGNSGIYSTYTIRSAKQLSTLFNDQGSSVTEIFQNRKATVTQSLDISYDKNKVTFWEYSFAGNTEEQDHKEAGGDTYKSPTYKGSFNTTWTSLSPQTQSGAQTVPYQLDGLNNIFLDNVGGTGKIYNLYVTDAQGVDCLIKNTTNGGEVKNATIEDCSFTSGVVEMNSGTLDTITVMNANKVEKSGSFVSKNTNNGANIKNVSITNVDYWDAVVKNNESNAQIDTLRINNSNTPYIIKDNQGPIKNITVEGSTVSECVIDKNSGAGSIDTITLQDVTAVNLVDENDRSLTNITVENSTFSGSIINVNSSTNAKVDHAQVDTVKAVSFVNENKQNRPVIQDVDITNAYFTGSAGFVLKNEDNAIIDSCTMKYTTCDGVGFVYENQATIRSCTMSDSVLCVNAGNAGFVQSNKGLIKNSQLFSTADTASNTSIYENYLTTYKNKTKYYQPVRVSLGSDNHIVAEQVADLHGYELMTVGLRKNNNSYSTDAQMAGFVYEQDSNTGIYNCSFTGSVYGNEIGGFAYKDNKGTIGQCYANVMLHSWNLVGDADTSKYSAAGFINTLSDGTIDQCHTLGIVDGINGAGFINTIEDANNKIQNSYTAIWQENCNRDSYKPFYRTLGIKSYIQNCYVMTDVIGIDDSNSWKNSNDNKVITYIADTDLRSNDKKGGKENLGDAVAENNGENIFTHAYHQFIAATENTYPYPMPVYRDGNTSKMLIAYGDWRPTKGVFLSRDSVVLYGTETENVQVSVVSDDLTKIVTVSYKDQLENDASASVTYNSDSGILAISGIHAGSGTVTVIATGSEGEEIGEATIHVQVFDSANSLVVFEENNQKLTPAETISFISGNAVQFTSSVSPNTANQTVNWSTSDPSVATIDATGLMTCLKAGTIQLTVITADNKRMQTFTVQITAPQVTSLSIKDKSGTVINSLQLQKNTSTKLSIDAQPAGADNSVTWVSSDESIATVDEDGTVKGIAVGTAVLTATSDNSQIQAQCEITVVENAKKPTEIYFEYNGQRFYDNYKALTVGDTLQLSVGVNPTDANRSVTWNSSDSTVASVDQNGLITALKSGRAQITIAAEGDNNQVLRQTMTVDVADIPITKLSVYTDSTMTEEVTQTIYVGAGSTLQLYWKVEPANATEEVSWNTNDPSVVTVDKNGLLKAVGKGWATIYVPCNVWKNINVCVE